MKKYGLGGAGGGLITVPLSVDVGDGSLFVERLAGQFMTSRPTGSTSSDAKKKTTKKAVSSQNSSGSSGGTAAAPARSDAEVLKEYYDTFKSTYTPERIEYEKQSADEIAAEIAQWLRPAYDDAMRARQERTDAYHAALDVDAIARGMGASTYVTDVKARQKDSEAVDLLQMESDYSASLGKYVSEAVERENARALEVEMFNSEHEHEVYMKAYEQALTMFALYRPGASGGSSGGSSGVKRTSSGSGQSNGGTGMATGVGYEFDDVVATTPENCERFVSGLNVAERRKIMLGSTEMDKRYRAELIASVGETRYWELIAGK